MKDSKKENKYISFLISQYISDIEQKTNQENAYDAFLKLVASRINYGKVKEVTVKKSKPKKEPVAGQNKRIRRYNCYSFSFNNENYYVRCYSDYLSKAFKKLLADIAEGKYDLNEISADKFVVETQEKQDTDGSECADKSKPMQDIDCSGCLLHKYNLAILLCLGINDCLSLRWKLAEPLFNNVEKIVYLLYNNLFSDNFVLFNPLNNNGTSESNLQIFRHYFNSADEFIETCTNRGIKISNVNKLGSDNKEHTDEKKLANLVINRIRSIPLADSVLNNDSGMFRDFFLTCISSVDLARNSVIFLNSTLSFTHKINNQISDFALKNNNAKNGYFTSADFTEELEGYAYEASLKGDHLFRLRDNSIFKKDSTLKCPFFIHGPTIGTLEFTGKIERLYFLALNMVKKFRCGIQENRCEELHKDVIDNLIDFSGINIEDINFAPPKPEYDTLMLLSGFFFRSLSPGEIRGFEQNLTEKAMDFSSDSRTLQISAILIIISILTDCEIYAETRKSLFHAAFSRAEYSFHRKHIKYLCSLSKYYQFEIESSFSDAVNNTNNKANPYFFFYYDLINPGCNNTPRKAGYKWPYVLKNKSWRSITKEISNNDVSDAISGISITDAGNMSIAEALAFQAAAFTISNIIQTDNRIDRIINDIAAKIPKHSEEKTVEAIRGYKNIEKSFEKEEDLRALTLRKTYYEEKLDNIYHKKYGGKSRKKDAVPLIKYLSVKKNGENLRSYIFYSDFILKKNNKNYKEQNTALYLPAASYRLANIPGFLQKLPGSKITLSAEEIAEIKVFQTTEKDLRYKFLFYRLVHECVDENSFEYLRIKNPGEVFKNVSFFEYDNIDYESVSEGKFYKEM